MYNLTISSIFRQSEKYLPQYLKQVEEVFSGQDGKCAAVWLEGDSTDNTYKMLSDAKEKLEANGHYVNLIKYDCNGPYWESKADKSRWLQLATCWNKCLDGLVPAKYTICVESDIRYDSSIVPKLIEKVDVEHNVVYPMLMIDRSLELFPREIFYDTWGFSRGGRKFGGFYPYYSDSPSQKDEAELLEITTGGGMIVSTYEHQKDGRFGTDDCIMKFKDDVKLYMHKHLKIYHPAPLNWGLK